MEPLHQLVTHSKGQVVARMILVEEEEGPANVGEDRVVSWASEDVEEDSPMDQSCDDTQTPRVNTLIKW